MKTKTPSFTLCAAVYTTVFVCASSIQHAEAALIAYDPFNYANVGGDLNGQSGNGSFGFSDAWAADPSVTIGNGSLSSPVQPFSTSGNAATFAAYDANRYIPRTLSTPLGTPGTTRYVSFLMRPDGILHQGAYEGWFSFSFQGDRATYVGMGSFADTLGLEVGGTTTYANLDAVVGTTNLYVLRMDFTAGVDSFRLYINPQPGAPEPAVADASQYGIDIGTISRVELDGPGAYTFDELRIGTTYADVVATPEPSTFVLGGLGLLGLLAVARRRRVATAC